ncbi:hypothetical protein EON66_06675 [archaeon]|nr:MAG: hypothetical protein EON66_06675 [archaeon]
MCHSCAVDAASASASLPACRPARLPAYLRHVHMLALSSWRCSNAWRQCMLWAGMQGVRGESTDPPGASDRQPGGAVIQLSAGVGHTDPRHDTLSPASASGLCPTAQSSHAQCCARA